MKPVGCIHLKYVRNIWLEPVLRVPYVYVETPGGPPPSRVTYVYRIIRTVCTVSDIVHRVYRHAIIYRIKCTVRTVSYAPCAPYHLTYKSPM